MFKSLNNIPIFRRLFIIFGLATIIPVVVILVLGRFYLNSLDERSQAVATSSAAQSIASQEQNDLLRMNALLGDLNNNIFAQESRVINDSSLAASGALISSEITAREINFQETILTYENSYALDSAANMSTILGIIQRDAPGSTLVSDQGIALDAVVKTDWPIYQKLQDSVLKQIAVLEKKPPTTDADVNAAYKQVYATLYQTNQAFTPLRDHWQKVSDAATTMLQTVTTVGASQTQPIFIATGIAIASILLI